MRDGVHVRPTVSILVRQVCHCHSLLEPSGGEFVYPRPRVFCASLADVFEDWGGPILDHNGMVLHRWPNGDLVSVKAGEPAPFIPGQRANGLIAHPLTMGDLRRDLFALIDATPNLDWLLLTKRPENVRRMWPATKGAYGGGPPRRSNVWLGTSVSEQASADRNIDLVVSDDWESLCPVSFLSAEPLLGPIDFQFPWIRHADGTVEKTAAIDWVIFGGESGHHARGCHVDWVRSGVEQCKSAGVACFVKQLGSLAYEGTADPHTSGPEAKNCHLWSLEDKKGGDPVEWPEELRVREFPEVAHADDVR